MKINVFIFFSLLLFLQSCDNCEDTVNAIPAGVEAWFPYSESVTDVTFIDTSGQEVMYNIFMGDDPIVEADGKCNIITERPFIHLRENDTNRILYNVWVENGEGFTQNVLSIWGTHGFTTSDGEQRIASKATDINDFDMIGEATDINGKTFDNVYTHELFNNSELIATIYLQRDKGILAFQDDTGLFFIKE